MIEVEKKALLTKEQYQGFAAMMANLSARDLGENNTSTTFFLGEASQVKVQSNVSQGTAKIAWKSGSMDGSEARTEIELSFPVSQVKDAKALISALCPDAEMYPTQQARHDYEYEGVSIALKHSQDWSYHIELDMVVESQDEVQGSLKQLEDVAAELGLRLLSQEEETAYVNSKLASKQT